MIDQGAGRPRRSRIPDRPYDGPDPRYDGAIVHNGDLYVPLDDRLAHLEHEMGELRRFVVAGVIAMLAITAGSHANLADLARLLGL